MAAAAGGRPLSPSVLPRALAICQSLSELSFASHTALPIPDAAGILTAVTDLAYNDAPWLGANSPNVR